MVVFSCFAWPPENWVPQCHAGGFQLLIHVLQPCCHDGDLVHQLLVHCWELSSRWWLSRPCAVAGTDCPHQPYHPRSVWLCSLVLLGHPRTVWLCSLVLLGCPHVVGVGPAGGFQLLLHVLQPCCHHGDLVNQLLVHCWESSS